MTTRTGAVEPDPPDAVPAPSRDPSTDPDEDGPADEAWRAVLSLHGDVDDDEWRSAGPATSGGRGPTTRT